MVDVREVAENIYMIDEVLYSIPKRGSVYLIDEEKKALIDTGPTTSAHIVLDGIRKAGVKPEDIDYIVVTHIHLDHAGGVGFLQRGMPKARVMVHPRGVRHLVNPEKLIRSVIEHQGEEGMARDGEVLPVDEHRVEAVSEEDVLKLGAKQSLKFIYAPGHVPHHICIYESRNGGIFVGDSVGIRVDGTEILMPSTVPPQFDLELYINTLHKLEKLNATRMYFSHFSMSDKAQENLESNIDELKVWGDIVARAAADNSLDSAEEKLIAHTLVQLDPIRKKMKALYEYLARVSIPMDAAGYMKYYREKHQSR